MSTPSHTLELDYQTRDGDRWDLIAYRFYGDAHRFEPIIRANPSVPIRAVLDAGTWLKIPVIEGAEIQPPATLPPWKR